MDGGEVNSLATEGSLNEVGENLLAEVLRSREAQGIERKHYYCEFRAKLGGYASMEKQRGPKDLPPRVTRSIWRCAAPLKQREYKKSNPEEKRRTATHGRATRTGSKFSAEQSRTTRQESSQS